MTTDLHSKSCSDFSSLRKRASTDSCETDKETKHSKRYSEFLFFWLMCSEILDFKFSRK
uniref:Uncharacterized protein n=1 Tax=Brugia timori TaxID=42155 RepID=A0A0R3Q7H1_9BILA